MLFGHERNDPKWIMQKREMKVIHILFSIKLDLLLHFEYYGSGKYII